MAATHFSGPVVSANGFTGSINNNGQVVTLTGLPTADPHVAGQVYNNAGVLTVSAG